MEVCGDEGGRLDIHKDLDKYVWVEDINTLTKIIICYVLYDKIRYFYSTYMKPIFLIYFRLLMFFLFLVFFRGLSIHVETFCFFSF